MTISKSHPALDEIKAAVEKEFPNHEFTIWWQSESCNEAIGTGPEWRLRCTAHRGVEVTPYLVITEEKQGRIILVNAIGTTFTIHCENIENATRMFAAALRADMEWIDAEWPGIDLRPPQGGFPRT